MTWILSTVACHRTLSLSLSLFFALALSFDCQSKWMPEEYAQIELHRSLDESLEGK